MKQPAVKVVYVVKLYTIEKITVQREYQRRSDVMVTILRHEINGPENDLKSDILSATIEDI